MRNLPLPRQRLLNASLVAAFGTATALWGLCAAAQTADAPPAGTAPVTGQSGQTLAPVTVNSETESSATSRDRKSTRLNSSHLKLSRMPSSA